MKMEHRLGNAAVDVEKFSKLGTQDLQNNQPQRALESFKYSYKRSKELEDGYTERACAFNLGAVYIALGEFRKGIDTLEKSVPPESKREGRSNGDLYFNFGVGYEGLGNNEEAVRNYKKALEEYKVERDNVQMEAECLEKLAQIYMKMHNQFAAETFGQLAAAYEILNNAVKQMWALSEKAGQLFVKGQLEEAETTADECLQLSSKCDSNANIGNLYNDLGLIYTQMTKYDKAMSCFEQALPLVRNVGDMKQEAVVLQNLGATFNFVGEFDKAVGYHQEAADLYAKLRNRNSQGQCFANLAFAQSQQGNIEEAGEAFLHAFQAAKDTGDRRTQWQVCEGLGAVAFTQKNYPKAVEYFKKALGLLAAADSSNSLAQDRIVAKLTKALEIQALGSLHAKLAVQKEENKSKLWRKSSERPVKEEVLEEVVKEEAHIEHSTPVGKSPEKPKRFVPVARRGSKRMFQKVARGFSSDTFGSTRGQSELERIDSRSATSDSSDSSDSEEEEEEEQEKREETSGRPSQGQPNSARESSGRASRRSTGSHHIGLGLVDSSGSDESDTQGSPRKGGNSDDDDKQAVKEAMKKIGDQSSDDEFKHHEADNKMDRESESESEDDSESDSPPEPPTSSPPVTAKQTLGTYETPAGARKKLHYGEIDFETQTKKEKGEKQSNPNFLSDNDDVSLPSSDDSTLDDAVEALKRKDLSIREASMGKDILEASGTYHNDEIEEKFKKENEAENEDDPVYQSIKSRASTLRNQDNEVDTPSFEKNPEFKSFSSLPRGVQSSFDEEEAARFEEHRRLVKEREENRQSTEKDSKTCVVM